MKLKEQALGCRELKYSIKPGESIIKDDSCVKYLIHWFVFINCKILKIKDNLCNIVRDERRKFQSASDSSC